MQHIVIQVEDSVDLSGLAVGTEEVTVTKDAFTVTGLVAGKALWYNPPEAVPVLVPHTHDEGATGPAIPA